MAEELNAEKQPYSLKNLVAERKNLKFPEKSEI
jgi:hypothetical protein